jgi:hypothetical protein
MVPVNKSLEMKLLDHVCSFVEDKMESGIFLEEAYHAALTFFVYDLEIEYI